MPLPQSRNLPLLLSAAFWVFQCRHHLSIAPILVCETVTAHSSHCSTARPPPIRLLHARLPESDSSKNALSSWGILCPILGRLAGWAGREKCPKSPCRVNEKCPKPPCRVDQMSYVPGRVNLTKYCYLGGTFKVMKFYSTLVG